MVEQSPTISCSPVEATFLASLLGANTLLGLEDPFPGWLTEEIQEAWTQARAALAERRFIEVQAAGGIVVDTAVAALVGTWAFPEASFVLTLTAGSSSSERHSFHLAQTLGVEQTLTAEYAVQLTALEGAPAIYRRVTQVLRLENQPAAPGVRTTLSEALLAQARALAVEPELQAAEEVLEQGHLPKATARSLAQMLAAPLANSALVCLARRATTWEAGGFGLLEGCNGLWRLRSFTQDNQNWVEAIPCTAADAGEEIRRAMDRVLPEPLPAM